jgi:hypothetical protein
MIKVILCKKMYLMNKQIGFRFLKMYGKMKKEESKLWTELFKEMKKLIKSIIPLEYSTMEVNGNTSKKNLMNYNIKKMPKIS